jgi:hypothetical protein
MRALWHRLFSQGMTVPGSEAAAQDATMTLMFQFGGRWRGASELNPEARPPRNHPRAVSGYERYECRS